VNITILSLAALFFLYILSYACSYVFKIYSNKFYRIFHFAGGYLIYVFINSLVKNWLLSLFGVIVIGILWEIYERVFWKYISRRKRDRPQKKDTTDDLFMDFLGGISAFVLTDLVQIVLKLLSP